jgi:hypothetical protein
MAGKKLTIKPSDEQQSQIKKATGRSIRELNIDLGATHHLNDQDLDIASGGSCHIGTIKGD